MTGSPTKAALLFALAELERYWKPLAAIIVAAFMLASGAHTLYASLARAEDVRAVKAEVAPLATRTAVVESTLAEQRTELRMIREQLIEIALTVGARQVAPAPARSTP